MYALNPHRSSHRRRRRQISMREEEAMQENPIVGSIFALLIAAALGGGGVYLYMKHRESTGPITDQSQIVQAKINLEKFSGDPKTGVVYSKTGEAAQKTIGEITPAFTQGLVQFQTWINKVVTQVQINGLKKDTGIAVPSVPLRTDGVLDQATQDWLVVA